MIGSPHSTMKVLKVVVDSEYLDMGEARCVQCNMLNNNKNNIESILNYMIGAKRKRKREREREKIKISLMR